MFPCRRLSSRPILPQSPAIRIQPLLAVSPAVAMPTTLFRCIFFEPSSPTLPCHAKILTSTVVFAILHPHRPEADKSISPSFFRVCSRAGPRRRRQATSAGKIKLLVFLPPRAHAPRRPTPHPAASFFSTLFLLDGFSMDCRVCHGFCSSCKPGFVLEMFPRKNAAKRYIHY